MVPSPLLSSSLGRPTEVFEDDVFVCENKYNERDKEIRRLKGLKVGGEVEAAPGWAVGLVGC